MSYHFPKIELSTDEQQWLGTICQQFLKGYLVDVDRLKKSWHEQGKWPKGFRPSEIDSRLLQKENKPTLLGIWHAYPVPENKWIANFDQLVRYVKERISNSTSTEIKVADIAKSIGITERSVSVLIHLLTSVGFYYSATVTPVRHDVVRIPEELEMYASLRLDDPEKMDDYLSYENIEAQIKKVFDEAETEAYDSSTKARPTSEDKYGDANQLYDKVKNLIDNTNPLDQTTAQLIIESADDAIKEFGNTNQDKKVELRNIKEKAEEVLPPKTIEELRKRAEGKALAKAYPKSNRMRNALYVLLVLSSIVTGLLMLKKMLPDQGDAVKVKPSPTTPSNLPLSLTPEPTPAPSDTLSYLGKNNFNYKGINVRIADSRIRDNQVLITLGVASARDTYFSLLNEDQEGHRYSRIFDDNGERFDVTSFFDGSKFNRDGATVLLKAGKEEYISALFCNYNGTTHINSFVAFISNSPNFRSIKETVNFEHIILTFDNDAYYLWELIRNHEPCRVIK